MAAVNSSSVRMKPVSPSWTMRAGTPSGVTIAGTPEASASSTTLPKVSVCEGFFAVSPARRSGKGEQRESKAGGHVNTHQTSGSWVTARQSNRNHPPVHCQDARVQNPVEAGVPPARRA